MKSDAIAYVVAGICFGVILGWVIATQQIRQAARQPAIQAPTAQGGATAPQAPPLDTQREQVLTTLLQDDPDNVEASIELANVYFDAERWPEAIRWYERALELDPANANASTDLGVSYYNDDRPDRALEQFEHSLDIDPAHTKTLFNKGIVLAFAREDLNGAIEQWQQVVDLAPASSEGLAARQLLENVATAHADAEPTSGQP
jgi:tetratricopeptide (TPR) repeat protein